MPRLEFLSDDLEGDLHVGGLALLGGTVVGRVVHVDGNTITLDTPLPVIDPDAALRLRLAERLVERYQHSPGDIIVALAHALECSISAARDDLENGPQAVDISLEMASWTTIQELGQRYLDPVAFRGAIGFDPAPGDPEYVVTVASSYANSVWRSWAITNVGREFDVPFGEAMSYIRRPVSSPEVVKNISPEEVKRISVWDLLQDDE